MPRVRESRKQDEGRCRISRDGLLRDPIITELRTKTEGN